MILNLHGLNGAGNNSTYKTLMDYFHSEYILSPSYTVHNFNRGLWDIEEKVDFATGSFEPLVIIASSTGALFAEYLAYKYNGQLILINPVVDPKQLDFALGHHKNYITGEDIEITQDDLDSFKNAGARFDKDIPRLVLIEKDDPVLNHALTIEKYENNAVIESYDGNSHRFTFWDDALPKIKDFYNRIYM